LVVGGDWQWAVIVHYMTHENDIKANDDSTNDDDNFVND